MTADSQTPAPTLDATASAAASSETVTLPIAKLGQGAMFLLALGGFGSGLSALGLAQTDPPATRAELEALDAKVDGLRDAVKELAFQVRLFTETGKQSQPVAVP